VDFSRVAALAIVAATGMWLSAAGPGQTDATTAGQTVRASVSESPGWTTGTECTPQAAARRCAWGTGRWDVVEVPTVPPTMILVATD
jgi:hypothetical protein